MSINKEQLKSAVITPSLKEVDLHSESAVNLLMGTAAQESQLGTYIKQIGSGPAVGIFQMEPATYNDIIDNYLKFNTNLTTKILGACGFSQMPAAEEMITNLKFSCIMGRVHYLRVKEAIPDADNVSALSRYWKKYYNTKLGKGTEEEFKRNYERYVG